MAIYFEWKKRYKSLPSCATTKKSELKLLIYTPQSRGYNKLFNNKKVGRISSAILLLLLLAFHSCATQPKSTSPQNEDAEAEAKMAFEEMASSTKTDPTGLVQSTSGELVNAARELTMTEAASFARGEPGWIEVSATQVFPNSMSRQVAEKQLQEQLRNEAVQKKVPASIDISNLLTDVTHETGLGVNEQTAWAGFFYSTVSGIITNQTMLDNRYTDLGSNRGFELKLTMNYYVEPVKGQRDPAFMVDAHLQNNLLKSGEELILSVTPGQDCYLYLFNLMADQNIMLMYPNEYITDNFLPAGKTLQIPDASLRKRLRFKVAPLPGKELSSESVYVVCTRSAIPVNTNLPRIGKTLPVIEPGSKNFLELQRWLTTIPLNQRVEQNLVYHVAR